MVAPVSLARRAERLVPAAPTPHHGHESISFDSGHAFPGILPDLSAVAQRALSTRPAEMLQYGPRQGLPEMREWIAGYLKADQADVRPEEVLVVNGAKHGIELVCRLLLDEGDTVVVTAPTYYTALPILKSFGATFIEVGQDAEGISVDWIDDAIGWLRASGRPLPKFIYNVPDFHNPTGVTMSRRRREALLALAQRHGIYVVEDSPYRALRYEGESQPLLKALDDSKLVINVGTFSKILAPGLRLGWLACRSDLLLRMMQLKTDGGSSPIVQRLLVDYLTSERLDAHTQLARNTYRSHRDEMLRALGREMPDVTTVVPQGGYYLWLKLPANASGDELARRAASMGVTVYPGSKFYAAQTAGFPMNARPELDHIRLTFSYAGLPDIEEGVRRLAAAWGSMRG
jgi:2-aminoadipate transaminase